MPLSSLVLPKSKKDYTSSQPILYQQHRSLQVPTRPRTRWIVFQLAWLFSSFLLIIGNPSFLVLMCLISARRDKGCPQYRVRNRGVTNHFRSHQKLSNNFVWTKTMRIWPIHCYKSLCSTKVTQSLELYCPIQKVSSNKNHSTQDSRVVPHRGTNWAALWLTAQIGRDAVLSESYGRGYQEGANLHTYAAHSFFLRRKGPLALSFRHPKEGRFI
jgi:hypothetical protein